MSLQSPPKWVWGIGGSLVVLGALIVLRNQLASPSPAASTFVTQAHAAGEVKEVSYELIEGWNFIAFPFSPTSVMTAAELIQDVANQGGYVTQVSRWDQDHWQEYVQRGTVPYGDDFRLKPFEAVFMLSHKTMTWTASGLLGLGATPDIHQLTPGWNAIGFMGESSAQSILDQTADNGRERAHEIDTWVSGNWDVFVKRWYAADHIEEYGSNFPVTSTQGYMIKATEEVQLPVKL